MQIIDTRGQECPAPLIATKRALKAATRGGSFKVLTDSRTALDNISRFLKDNLTEFSVTEKSGIWTITIRKGKAGSTAARTEEYCETNVPYISKGDFIIVFDSDKMGEGDEKLGLILISNFIKAINDLDLLPSKMIFYNNGVRLGSVDSPVIGDLEKIEKLGVELLFCATCTGFYSLEEKIKIGTRSNMFEIARLMASAGHIIKP